MLWLASAVTGNDAFQLHSLIVPSLEDSMIMASFLSHAYAYAKLTSVTESGCEIRQIRFELRRWSARTPRGVSDSLAVLQQVKQTSLVMLLRLPVCNPTTQQWISKNV